MDYPLFTSHEKEREGYVSNVVYCCGAIIHNNELVIPYTMSDINSCIVTVAVNELLSFMRAVLVMLRLAFVILHSVDQGGIK